jgi:hypothetical protein
MIKERTLIREDEENAKFGVTVPRKMLQQLDEERGDAPRSIFIIRLLETRFNARKEGMK